MEKSSVIFGESQSKSPHFSLGFVELRCHIVEMVRAGAAHFLPSTPAGSLFLFPHPDDEVFVSGILSASIAEGRVQAAWLTSGGFDGQEDLRELETSSAMGLLGLKREQYHFLRLPDGQLGGHLKGAIEKVAALIVSFQPEVAWVTAFEGGHADRAVHVDLRLRLPAASSYCQTMV